MVICFLFLFALQWKLSSDWLFILSLNFTPPQTFRSLLLYLPRSSSLGFKNVAYYWKKIVSTLSWNSNEVRAWSLLVVLFWLIVLCISKVSQAEKGKRKELHFWNNEARISDFGHFIWASCSDFIGIMTEVTLFGYAAKTICCGFLCLILS